MRIVHRRVIFFLSLIQSLCFGMHSNQCIAIKTSDNMTTFFKKSYIKQSLVLNVLQAHQLDNIKKNSPLKTHLKNIVIPKACNDADNVTAYDVMVLHELLCNQDEKFIPYMNNKSFLDKMSCFHAAYVLGAHRQLSLLINHIWCSEMRQEIESHVITPQYYANVLKRIIQRGGAYSSTSISMDKLHLFSNQNGACFYIPESIVKEERHLVFDGINPFTVRSLIGGKDYGYMSAISSNGKYYAAKTTTVNGDGLTLYQVKDDVLQSTIKLLENRPKITHVVFDPQEKHLIVGLKSDEKNLLYFNLEKLAEHNRDDFYYFIGHSAPISKIIIDDSGRYAASADRESLSVIVWDLVRKIAQRLHDKYEHAIGAMSFAKAGQQLWICSGPIVSLWQEAQDKDDKILFKLMQSIKLDSIDAFICRLLISEKMGRIVVGRTDGKLNIICMNTKEEVACLKGHTNFPITGLVGVNDIVVSSTNGAYNNLILWNIVTGKRIATLSGHEHIHAVALMSDMRYIVSQSLESIRLWDILGAVEEVLLSYVDKPLLFLDCYKLYCWYKKVNNNGVVNTISTAWAKHLPNIAGAK